MISQKYIKVKGVVASIAAGIVLAAYILFTYKFYVEGIKMNDLFFIVTGLGICTFTGLLFSFFKNIIVRTLLLFCCVFYFILITLFIHSLISVNEGFVYSKTALIGGLLIGFIYSAYDIINNYLRHRPSPGI